MIMKEAMNCQWQYLYGVVKLLRELGMNHGNDNVIGEFVVRMLGELFTPLDKKSEEGKKFKDIFKQKEVSVIDMMTFIISSLISLAKDGTILFCIYYSLFEI